MSIVSECLLNGLENNDLIKFINPVELKFMNEILKYDNLIDELDEMIIRYFNDNFDINDIPKIILIINNIYKTHISNDKLISNNTYKFKIIKLEILKL